MRETDRRLTLSMVDDTARCDADEPWIDYVGIERVNWMKGRKEEREER